MPRTTSASTTVDLRSQHDGREGRRVTPRRIYEKQISSDKPAFIGARTAADRALLITAIFS